MGDAVPPLGRLSPSATMGVEGGLMVAAAQKKRAVEAAALGS
jgi:hypothetical protein